MCIASAKKTSTSGVRLFYIYLSRYCFQSTIVITRFSTCVPELSFSGALEPIKRAKIESATLDKLPSQLTAFVEKMLEMCIFFLEQSWNNSFHWEFQTSGGMRWSE